MYKKNGIYIYIYIYIYGVIVAELTEAVEYTDYLSAEG